MRKGIINMFEKIRSKITESSEKSKKAKFERILEKIGQESKKGDKEYEAKVEKIRSRPGFRDDVLSVCSRFGISEEEANKIIDGKNYGRAGYPSDGYNIFEEYLSVEVHLDQMREYINSEIPKEIVYRHLGADDFSGYGKYSVNIAKDIKIIYQGYEQVEYDDDLNFIPPQYKKETTGYKTRFYLE
ncbi:MAG: hypothetical protein A3B99_03470 [Candidatus Yanofskybacteria bacterium RIFCSPHIGHO2_02_FULL_44_12b]|uniref:Uncharacterized protein n=2 Tax=Candidatus Yanofskyibacteriota TaxID=1752733 RepID=A0A1F8GJU8_9BACT|nr:MAG: hypothetical protein UW79_C0031G0008 [Candidatus Yanofskybacteria bacterium GW2011_GWA2_44_9]OGN04215.1 MAG: hypothetical protein A2659_04000 [Candidatus Yanofskybacteria bacterium RIFCSPHIGHO2_01_FULL_44_24]OGN13917.1 MAG: hypothetical protein A3B99_03470 [Candidatus Yanofskybacteria bacterium RIFCSPHIGHO2_02_FULL_44_12b]OGN25601.1 MAG: hypothetical protein A2925_01750 [Candidatus Yanofskybacteria bacterium RIFCSPLOWO2_01_FULL_44_22]